MANGLKPAITTRVINFGPVSQQALRDLSACAENGIAPPPSTAYEVVDGQVRVPPSAAERTGVQPVVVARALGKRAALSHARDAMLRGIAVRPAASKNADYCALRARAAT